MQEQVNPELAQGIRIIRASEVNEYEFCHRAWWLHRVQGAESANLVKLEEGQLRHLLHGRRVRRAVILYRAALALMALGIFFLVIALALALVPD